MNSRRRWIRYGIGGALSVAALVACAAQVRWHDVESAFGQARWPWILAALASVLTTLALVTLRWGVIVRGGPRGAYGPLWNAVVLGQAVNILAPLRFGEGARVLVTCRELGIPAGRVALALAFERLFDVLVFAAAAVTILTYHAAAMPAMPALAGVGRAFAVVAAILGLFLILAMLAPRLSRAASRHRWAAVLASQFDAVRAGWLELDRSRLAIAAALTACVFFSSLTTNMLVFQALGFDLPWLAGVVLLVALQLGTAIVSVPGNIGVFHYLTVVTLSHWQIAASPALAAAVVLHIVSLGPKVLLAAPAFVRVRNDRAS